MRVINNRIPPPVIAMVAGASMWWIDRHLPLLKLLGTPWNRIGWGFIATGILVDVMSVAFFIRAKTTVNPARIDGATSLVVSGLYRISRNPMYLGLITILIGWAFLLGSLSPYFLIVVFEQLIVRFQIQPEERALARKFGDEYTSYAQRVNRWIGFIDQ